MAPLTEPPFSSLPAAAEAPPSGVSPGGARDPYEPDPRLGRQVTHYLVEQRLGGGGMGAVYRATDLLLDRPVALKFLLPHLSSNGDARARFTREARAASALDHVNIGAIHEIGQTQEQEPFIAMTYYTGETLQQKIARGPLPLPVALDYALQMACGLKCAHDAGIVHRDIKPANVIVTEEGVVKVLDFGLAKGHDMTLTQTGTTLGTARYMSPEQAQGCRLDARTDLWSLGVVFHEMLTGSLPFRGEYEPAVLYAIVHEPPLPLAAPTPVAEVVHCCLQKDPADRYQDAGALVHDLRLLLRTYAPAAQPTQLQALRRRWSPTRSQIALAVLVLLAAIAALLLRQNPAGPERQLLAVLPFDTEGAPEQTQTLADGLQGVLSSRLTQAEAYSDALSVLPASEIPRRITPSEARARFQVALAVDGSVQQTGTGTSLIINLVDTRTRATLASREVLVQEGDRRSLLDLAFSSLLEMLEVELQPQDRARLARGNTDVPQAEQYYLLAQGLLRKAQREDDVVAAGVLFESALGADPRYARAMAGLGEAYWKRFDLTMNVQWADSALQYSRRALALDDRLAEVYVTMGLTYFNQNRLLEAIQAYTQAIEIEPRNAEAYRQRGISYRFAGQNDRAERDHLRSVELQPRYWRNYHSLATFYYRTGDYHNALARYEQGLALAPDNVTLLNGLGAVQNDLLQFDASIKTFEQVLRLQPDYTDARSNLATAYFYSGRFADAARLYRLILADKPRDYQAQSDLADAHYWMPGARQQALAEYRAAIDLARPHLARNPRDPKVLGALATFYLRLGRPDSTRQYLDRLEAAQPAEQLDGEMAFGIGEVYLHLGERQKGLAWMDRGLARGKGWSKALHSPWLKDLQDDPQYRQILASHPRPGTP